MKLKDVLKTWIGMSVALVASWAFITWFVGRPHSIKYYALCVGLSFLYALYIVARDHERIASDGKKDLFAGCNAGLSEASKYFIGKEGVTGFSDRKPDSNGKVYQYFHLITDGELKGMYRPMILTYGQSEFRNELRERELTDIINSGFHVHVIDPKGS